MRLLFINKYVLLFNDKKQKNKIKVGNAMSDWVN